ncbi:D-glycero-beta-D-manno-heptose 1-phosphate adenylyltransferase [Actinocrinis sp.]|uniref:D-glycero-beta-D-manno-heptose 1-phosphate adenylyltransferase n=1 Tax=Actinocrinis sp. TaxID=1920516 RepID=UPI002D5C463C|nr:D-glycero-beta-D-manno-heptose 1-phosphate adenylyltransferase [Actinocrinis sp.]HZP50107.1 D-glycero-beta-D-manno-heptose 1-phosphate adenylyltransferase [Actinocrinis sp.]
MTIGPLVVIGDALLDRDLDGAVRRLCPDTPAPVVDEPMVRPRPGGAALAAHLAARAGHQVTLVCPLGDDAHGQMLRELIDPRIRLVALPWPDAIAQKTRVRVDGRTLLRIDHPAQPYTGDPGLRLTEAFEGAGAILVSDYAGGVTSNHAVRDALTAAARHVPVVWDPHPRGAAPVPGTLLATPNQAEAAAAAAMLPGAAAARGSAAVRAAAEAADKLRTAWPVSQLAITLGAQGVLLRGAANTQLIPARDIAPTDACGAGDAFAAATAAALASGALPSEAVVAAVDAAASFLGAGGVSALDSASDVSDASPFAAARLATTTHADLPRPAAALPRPADPFELAAKVRAHGGTVVATGGCFDLLHAGHVHCLRTARAAGDCLIVCLNSDASVRRLKGAGRPLNNEADRAAILESLSCVDAVVVFNEATPEETLRRLRPDVWVKGGDYAADDLPEAPLVRGWGGRVLTVPYLSGRSTTGLVRSARNEAA